VPTPASTPAGAEALARRQERLETQRREIMKEFQVPPAAQRSRLLPLTRARSLVQVRMQKFIAQIQTVCKGEVRRTCGCCCCRA
jgi:hypothetical protein